MSGLFVLAVAEARACAVAGGIGVVSDRGESVYLTAVDGGITVESAGLFTDSDLHDRVCDLLTRHC